MLMFFCGKHGACQYVLKILLAGEANQISPSKMQNIEGNKYEKFNFDHLESIKSKR